MLLSEMEYAEDDEIYEVKKMLMTENEFKNLKEHDERIANDRQ